MKIKLYWTTILPVVLCGCLPWSLTLREELGCGFKSRVLRKVFGLTWDEVTAEWRRLHNEELQDLCSSKNIIRVKKSRRNRWAGRVACVRETCLEVFDGETWGEREYLENPGVDWRIILKYIFKIWNGGMFWIDLAQDKNRWRALVNAEMEFGFQKRVKFLPKWETVGFLRRNLLHGVG